MSAVLFNWLVTQPRPVSLRYLASVLSVIAALLFTLSARSLFATTAYSLFLAAVMLTSWYGGLTPGLLAILFSLLALDRYFVSPEAAGVLSRDKLIHMSIFLLAAGIINYLNRARMRAEKNLLESHQALQSEVGIRTADLQHANDTLRRLSGQLMRLQDEERRRMARLLHETVAQSLAVLKMDLAVVKRHGRWTAFKGREALHDALVLTDECIREVRTLSYLLHPPLLDEAGLSSALQWYAAGFEQRSGIKTQLDIPGELGRLPQNIEIAVFRLVQECLTNIHRHAESSDAVIRVTKTESTLAVEVSDHGHESQQGWEVCAEAANGLQAVESVEMFKPDIAIVDIGMPELNGLEATRQILTISPRTEVLILTMHRAEEVVAEVLKAGARGYVLKSDADQSLIAAVEALLQHKPFLTSGVTDVILSEFLSGRTASLDAAPERNVTPREREIIQLLAEGKSNKEVAAVLKVSTRTIETHRANIMHKLDINSLSGLVRYAIRSGIVQA